MAFFKKKESESTLEIDLMGIRDQARQMVSGAAGESASLSDLFAVLGEDERNVFRVVRANKLAAEARAAQEEAAMAEEPARAKSSAAR